MKFAKLEDMTRGWFVGAFSPTALPTNACEVSYRHYKAGDKEATHVHRIATEVTLVVAGTVRMCNHDLGPGDIIVLEPGDTTDFEALTDATNVVVKVPGVLNDKYPVSTP